MLSIKMKQSYDSPTIIMFLMLLYLISTLIQGVLPISINRILLFLIIILIIIDFLSSSTKDEDDCSVILIICFSLYVVNFDRIRNKFKRYDLFFIDNNDTAIFL